MKVLAVNSSARTGIESKTELVLDHLIQGLRDAGAEVELVELRKKKINYCIGCFQCWSKTPGECVHKDDMSLELLPKFREADLAILATPLFHYTVNATMKTFIERTLPLIEPYMRRKGGETYHPLRDKHPAVAIVSVAGFPNMSVFDQLSSYVNFLYAKPLVAEIYRPAAEILTNAQSAGVRDDVFAALRQAGKELATTMKVSEGTLDLIQQPLADPDMMAEIANCMWDTCIEEGLLPREMVKKKIAPRPQSMETFMALLPMGFNPEAASDAECVLQFDFSGKVEGSCHFTIKDAAIVAESGQAEKADLIIETPFDVWLDIMSGKADGAQMFMEQKYTTKGDANYLLKMGEWFSGK